EESGEGEEGNEPGDDEGGATDDRAERAADAPGAEDRQLRRSGARQQIAGGDRVLELVRGQPALPVDAQLPQQGNVCRRSAEAGGTDASPLHGHIGETRWRRHSALQTRRRRVRTV